MKVCSRGNRITAIFVALLYMFFSTFGAVAHTHALPLPGDNASGVTHSAQKQVAASSAYLSSPQHCAVCDWQAHCAPPVTIPQCMAAPLTLSFPQVRPVYSFFSVCQARFSSRAPPTV